MKKGGLQRLAVQQLLSHNNIGLKHVRSPEIRYRGSVKSMLAETHLLAVNHYLLILRRYSLGVIPLGAVARIALGPLIRCSTAAPSSTAVSI
jgi:hypothetical protein